MFHILNHDNCSYIPPCTYVLHIYFYMFLMYTYILHIYVQLFIVHILLLWQVQSQHMDRVYWMIWSISDVQLLLMMMTGMKMSMLIIDDASHTFICFSRRHPKRDDFVLNYWSQTVIDEMKWKVLDVQDCNFLFNFGGIYVYVQSNYLCWLGVHLSYFPTMFLFVLLMITVRSIAQWCWDSLDL